jgi:WD repeat-containing protein 35
MRKETDEMPILVDTGMSIKSIKWNPNGNVLAVAGSLLDNSDGKGGV